MSDWENIVRLTTPYTPGEQPRDKDIIKLNTNENPFPPSPACADVLRTISAADMRLYPDPHATELVRAIAETYSVKESQVFVGVGSDDVIATAYLTFFNSERPVLFPDITYSFYDVWADVYGVPFEKIPLKEGFHIDPEDYVRPNGGIIFPNPNAPTGVLEPVETIERIVSANPGSVVIVDEAYIDFGGISCLPLIGKYDNLLIVQTFSKSRSGAGLRIGYALGNEKLIRYLNEVRFSINSYTMSRFTIECGAAVMRDTDHMKNTCSKIIRAREHAKNALSRLGFEFPDSKANFLFVTHKSIPAKTIFEELKKRKILVRWWDKPQINNYLRITVGTSSQMQKLTDALTEIISGSI